TGIPLSKILSFISYKNMNFLILDCPTDNTLPQYLREFKRNRVSDIVRVCEPTYSTMLLSENNITVHDWQFRDGAVPPANIVNNWLDLVEKNGNEEMNTENPTIAVHCVAGLGRAPVLVAIALIEAGMKPLQAVEHIRRYRRGAFNTNQLDFLDKYK
ncbi:dual specificity protein phosphatase CDC14B, partial [Neocallimastix californiae]